MEDTRTARSRATATLAAAVVALAGASASTARAQSYVESEPYVSAPDAIVIDMYRPALRFGMSGVGGGFVGVVDGGAAGIAPRVGVQLDRVIAIYLQVHALIGNFGSSSGGSRVAGFLFHELMVDLTVLDRLQVGLAPSLDFVWNCREANGRDPCGNGEARFGGDLRFALALGDEVHRTDTRHGLVVSLEVHPTWVDPDFTWMTLFGIGGEMF
jgi:hypothetical protein